MNTELEVGLILASAAWALGTVSATGAWLVRGWVARREAKAAQLAEVEVAVKALVRSINSVEFASRDIAAQRWWGTKLAEVLRIGAEFADGYRQNRTALGIANAAGRVLEFDRLGTTANREFTNGPLQAMNDAHLHLMMTAADFPELANAATDAATAAGELAQIQVRTRHTAAELHAAQEAAGEALTELAESWKRLNEPPRLRLTPRRKPKPQLTA